MTKRGEIVTEIKNLLSDIQTANGYNSDIGQNIQEWRVSAVEAIQLPVVIIEDTEEAFTDDDAIIGQKLRILTVAVRVIADIQTHVEELREMVEDVFVALSNDETLGGKVRDVQVENVNIEVDQNKERVAMATINLSIKYDSLRWEF